MTNRDHVSRMSRVPLVAVLVAIVTLPALAAYWTSVNDQGPLPTFRSYGELASFLERVGPGGPQSLLGGVDTAVPEQLGAWRDASAATESDRPYSQTNVQVEGVDELDIVKTDGTYLYIASTDFVTIARAYPPEEMQVVAEIPAHDAVPDANAYDWVGVVGLFIDGDRLVTVASGFEWPGGAAHDSRGGEAAIWAPGSQRTVVSVFDLSEVAVPTLTSSHSVSGAPVSARLLGSHVYVVVQAAIYKVDGTYTLPLLCRGETCADLDVRSIYYDPEAQEVASFTNLLAVDVREGVHEAMSVVTGFTSTLYMSPEALYLTFLKWEGLAGRILLDSQPPLRTTIYKVHVAGLSLAVVARGDVAGMLLDQFSLDERDGYLRVATTTGWADPSNEVYVLDADLRIVGALTGLAPTERIFAARFVSDVLYLVTFRQVDPFFVIDLSDPGRPRLLGELKIPGFSTYLHPLGDDSVLGIGQEDNSLKLSVFDVSDPTNPQETSRFFVGADAWSPAMYDHKAVLIDPGRSLLVLPVEAWRWSVEPFADASPSGAYVFRVAPGEDIRLRGVVAHGDGAPVSRSLYIGDVLYTTSPTLVKANSLADLTELGSLAYGAPRENLTASV